jgi:hypothetical protein
VRKGKLYAHIKNGILGKISLKTICTCKAFSGALGLNAYALVNN